MWRWSVSPEMAPNEATYLDLTFEKGDIVAIDGKTMTPAEVLTELNRLGGVTLCVVCGEASQLERLVARDGLTAEQAAQRIAAQLPAVVKAARSDHTVDNSGGREASAAQLEALLQPLQRSHPRRERVAWAWARLPCASNGGISAMLWVTLAVIRLFAAVRGRRGSAL